MVRPLTRWLGCDRRLRRERIGWEDRVVEDHRLGLAAEEANFQFVPELVGIGARLAVAEPVEPAASLVVMSETVVSHRQEYPILGDTPGPALTNLDSGNDFQKEAVGPAATATFHGDTVAAGMLLQE